ncbi:MAG: c-type cytochrome [Porticoccus sp.]
MDRFWAKYLLSWLIVGLSNSAVALDFWSITESGRAKTTYEKFLPIAEAGDPDVQNFLGYMFFYGEGVPRDYQRAHEWFHLAAEQGDLKAQRNLGVFHARAVSRIPERFYDAEEANIWFSLSAANSAGRDVSSLASEFYADFLDPDTGGFLMLKGEQKIGEKLFSTFCAGCHGFDGVAAIPMAPSFAYGDSLEKSDATLLHSIMYGKNIMPSWTKTATVELSRYILLFIRQRFDPVGALPPQVAALSADHFVGSDYELGEETYARYCAGCHGFNGIAYYVNSPSFALGERMDKSDSELMGSIRNGLGIMPSWEDMIDPRQVRALVTFIRTLAPTYERGITGDIKSAPRLHLRFKPRGERDDQWSHPGSKNSE